MTAVIYAAGSFSITLPQGWQNLADALHPNGQHVYVFTPPGAGVTIDGLWLQSEPAKHRTLAQFVADYGREITAPSPVKTVPPLAKPKIEHSRAHMVCRGTQAAWLLIIADGNGLSGDTVLAVNGRAAVSATYMHGKVADPAVARSLDTLCLK